MWAFLLTRKRGEPSLAKKLVNLWAEDGANIIDDDTTATLIIENTAAGIGLKGVSNTGSGLEGVSATGVGLIAERTGTAGPTIAPLRAVQSIASGVFLDVRGAFVSTASLPIGSGVAANNTAFYIPVYHGSENVKGFIPVIKDTLV